MTAPARKLGPFEAGSFTITIAGPIRMALNLSLPEQLDNGHFVIGVALVKAAGLPAASERREADREPPGPEHHPEDDIYGENGEKTPYHPARPRGAGLPGGAS